MGGEDRCRAKADSGKDEKLIAAKDAKNAKKAKEILSTDERKCTQIKTNNFF